MFDLAVLYGDAARPGAGMALLVEAGGDAIAVLADRILGPGEVVGSAIARPSWDLLFAAP